MRRARLVGASLGVLLASGACATATMGTRGQGQLDEAVPQSASRTLSASERDSLFAQAFADRQGPRAWIYADATSESGSRRVRANFHLDDDAYVLVGHLDADGVLRIVFPTNPGDDGFVRGDKTYMTDQFFAGFTDQYRYRAQEVSLTRGLTPQMDSYDGGLGYVFMVASWRPMRFDQFSSEGTWNRYELTDDEYLRDPRAAVQELASVLTGDNREAFTVQYARYYSTISSLGSLGNSFDSGYCSGFGSIGFASGLSGFNPMLGLLNSLNLGYGTGGCFGAGGYDFTNYGVGYGILPPVPVIPRTVVDRHRPAPQPVPKRRFPTAGKNAAPSDTGQSGASPEYRRRGLITTDDGARAGRDHASPRAQSRLRAEQSPRPGIEQMINRRVERGTTDGSEMPRAYNRANQDGNVPRRVPLDRQSRPAPTTLQRPEAHIPEPRTTQPRVDRPHVEQAPPRVAAPRPVSPPPAPAAQSTTPAPTPSRP